MFGTVGKRIKYLRERRGWSQLDIEEKTGINNSVISRIENDKRSAQAEEIVTFCKLFNVSSDYLLGRTSDPKKAFSNNAEDFIASIDLGSDDLLKHFSFSFQGKQLTENEAREFIAISQAIFATRKALK
jgi:transcriptional regulator with XRE-family HTH domain